MITLNAQVTPEVNYIVQTTAVFYRLSFRPTEPLKNDICLWKIKWKS